MASAAPLPNDNHGWSTGWRLATLALQYNVSAESETAAEISTTIEALLRLNKVTGIPGLPARSLAAPTQMAGVAQHPTHWEWNKSPSMPGWMFIGNTSSDELTGHIPGYTLALLLADGALDSTEKQTLTELLANITLRIVHDGFRIIDVDGQPTKWGEYSPEALNGDPDRMEERGLNSLQILVHLICAHRFTELPELENAFHELVEEHAYLDNLANQKISAPDDLDGSDNELAFIPFLALHYACRTPGSPAATQSMCETVWPSAMLSLQRSYEILRSEESGLWALIYATIDKGSEAAAAAAATGVSALQRYPLELVMWPTDPSARIDLPTDIDMLPWLNQSSRALPRDECTLAMEWGRSPFQRAPQGNGLEAMDPVMYLIAFWLGEREGLLGATGGRALKTEDAELSAGTRLFVAETW